MLNYDNDNKCWKLTIIKKYSLFVCRTDTDFHFER